MNIGKSRVVDVADATADYVAQRHAARAARRLPRGQRVSSPNTPGLRGLQAVDTLRPLLEAVRDAGRRHAAAREDRARPHRRRGRPPSPDLAVELGLAGVIATNTTISREGLTTDPAVVEAAGAGGLSGAPLRARALEVLRLVRDAVPADFCVISVGGRRDRRPTCASDWMPEPTLVQGYTAFLYRGPLWARQINRGLTPCTEDVRRDVVGRA